MSKVTITESELKQIVLESVQKVLNESEMDEALLQNVWRGVKGVGKGIGNALGNAVDNAKMNAYQSQIQGMQSDNEKIQAQINQLEQSKEQKMQQAAQAAAEQVDQEINALKAKMGDVQGVQNKWDAAGKRINSRQQTGYINNRQYTPQNATNPQQGNMNY